MSPDSRPSQTVFNARLLLSRRHCRLTSASLIRRNDRRNESCLLDASASLSLAEPAPPCEQHVGVEVMTAGNHRHRRARCLAPGRSASSLPRSSDGADHGATPQMAGPSRQKASSSIVSISKLSGHLSSLLRLNPGRRPSPDAYLRADMLTDDFAVAVKMRGWGTGKSGMARQLGVWRI